MTALPNIASLWIGPRLSFLELLCLKSFVDAGHHVTLYSYGELENPPVFCDVRDAREVWDNSDIIHHARRQSPAIHSDIWRIRLMRQTDAIWVDTDAYCVKPLEPRDGYLVGIQDRGRAANGVLRLPKDSPALAAFDDFLLAPNPVPPWWRAEDLRRYQTQGHPFDFRFMKWGTTGPAGLTHFLNQTGEIDHAVSADILYPLPQEDKTTPLAPAHIAESYLTTNTQSVHFYTAGFRKILASNGVPADSYLAKLCAKHAIALPRSPPAADIPPPQKPAKRWQRLNCALASQLVFDMLARAYGHKGERIKFVQVGANDGRLADPFYNYAQSGQFDALLIEPSPVYFAQLAATYQAFANVQTLNIGVADAAGEMTLYQLDPDFEPTFPPWARGCASMIRQELVSVLSGHRPVTDDMITATAVPVARLDSLLKEYHAYDAALLIIDVEGFEANVFRSFEFEGFLPYVILFEHTHLKADDADEIYVRLHQAGYRMWVMKNDIMAIHTDWLPPSVVGVFDRFKITEWQHGDSDS